MTGEQANHPARDTLAAYGLGKLPPAEAVAVESHIAECQECCETLLDLGSDTFTDLVRRSDAIELDSITGTQTIELREADSETVCNLPDELTGHPRYCVLELLGKGGMGDVYKAEHRLMHRSVALKVINRELVQNDQAIGRFQREVQSAAQLTHPNIVAAYDAEQAGDVHFLVMEYVPGDDLSEVVKRDGPLEITQACDYIRQAAEGLQHAHERGMVHRDVKPHNLMVTSEGQVKILDFGLATLAAEAIPNEEYNEAMQDGSGNGDSPKLTSAGSMMGTPDFISPEQACDARGADIRSDIYSLGCTFYYLLTGRPPFTEGSALDRVKAHSETEPKSIENVRDDIPPDLAEIVRRMMAKQPSDRFQKPADVAETLAPFVDTPCPVPAPRKLAKPRQSTAFSRRYSQPPVIATALALAVCVLAGLIYVGTNNGTLVVDSDDDDVEVIIRSGDDLRIVDTVTGSTVKRLRSGEYSVGLKGDDNDFELSQERFVLKRGGKVIVKITRSDDGAGATVKSRDAASDDRISPTRRRFTFRKVFVSEGAPRLFGEIFPDGKRMPMVEWANNGNLAIRELYTGKIRRVTHNDDWSDGYAYWSKPSPDGRQIACCWPVGDTGHCQLRVIDGETGDHRLLYHNPDGAYLEPHAWFPDGKHIVVVLSTGVSQSQLVVFSVKDGSQRILKSLDWRWPETASVSPDGRYLVYDLQVHEDSSDRNLFIMALDGTAEIELTHPAIDAKPLWSPNGQGVVFTSDRTGNNGLWYQKVLEGRPESEPQLLVDNMPFGKPIGFTADEWYFFRTTFTWSRGDIFVAPLGRVNPDKPEVPQKAIQHNEGFNSLPCWSPDGSHLAFTLNGETLVVREMKSGRERKLRPSPPLKLRNSMPCWTSDGQALVIYAVDFKGRRGLYSVDAQSGGVTPLVGPSESFFAPSFTLSPDGKTAYYLRSRNIVARDLSTNEETVLHQGDAHSLALSPDGSQLAFASNNSIDVLSVVDRQRRELHKVADGQVIPVHVGIAWTSVDNSVVFATADAESYHRKAPAPQSTLWKVSVESGSATDLGLAVDGLSQMRVHPDGHRIAYTRKPANGGAEVWALQNFLPPVVESQ